MKKRMKRMVEAAGVGILTAAALAAGAAYLVSKTPQYRRAKAWARKARHEVARNVRAARRMGEAEYRRAVDRAVRRYGKLSKVNAREATQVAKDMKAEWRRIRKSAKGLARVARGRRPTRRAARLRRKARGARRGK